MQKKSSTLRNLNDFRKQLRNTRQCLVLDHRALEDFDMGYITSEELMVAMIRNNRMKLHCGRPTVEQFESWVHGLGW